MKLLLTGGSGFIGTNAMQYFAEHTEAQLNLDLQAPLNGEHTPYWLKANILDLNALTDSFRKFQPEAVIHLAARAECDETTTVEKGYQMNTVGTANVLAAIKATPSVQRVIITSSQFVCGPGYLPKNDEDFSPVTIYGQSKVITEQLTRKAGLACTWTIIRPTNIWGPWHLRYTREFWKIVQRGLYVHPGGKPVIRCYGFVGNLVRQMHRILQLPPEIVNRQVFYLSDPPDDIKRWANAFSLELRGTPVRVIPRFLLQGLGRIGDVISKITGRPFFITSSRYFSMTSDYSVPMHKTYEALGQPPISLEEGVQETAAWLRRFQSS